MTYIGSLNLLNEEFEKTYKEYVGFDLADKYFILKTVQNRKCKGFHESTETQRIVTSKFLLNEYPKITNEQKMFVKFYIKNEIF